MNPGGGIYPVPAMGRLLANRAQQADIEIELLCPRKGVCAKRDGAAAHIGLEEIDRACVFVFGEK